MGTCLCTHIPTALSLRQVDIGAEGLIRGLLISPRMHILPFLNSACWEMGRLLSVVDTL